jgi:hypothetical protein
MFTMFFQEVPAETTGYMIFGYVVIFGTLILYLVSLFTRWQNHKKDQEVLEELEKDK